MSNSFDTTPASQGATFTPFVVSDNTSVVKPRIPARLTASQVLPAAAPAVNTPEFRTVLMEGDAFYRWLEELVGVDPSTGDCYPADFAMDMADDGQSVFLSSMAYRDSDCGPVVAFVLRGSSQVEVLMSFEPDTSLRQIVDLMLERSKLKAA